MNNRSFWILMILVLIKLFISLPFLTFNPIDLDEPFSIFHSQNSLSGLFQIFQSENNPPAHFILLHFWEQLFGIGPISVRSLSLLFSVLTIFVLWKIGNRFFNEKSAIIVCLLFIFSDFHHYHGIEARTYSLLVFEFALLLYLLLMILIETKKINWKHPLLLGLINVLLFYTHYIAPLIFLAEGIVLLIYFNRILLKPLLIMFVVFILGIFPWISVLLGRVNSVKTSGTWLSQAQFSELYGLINKFFNDKWSFLGFILIGGTLLILKRAQVMQLLIEKKKQLIILSLVFLIPFLSAFSLSRLELVEIFYDRYLFFLTIPLFFMSALLFQTKGTVYSISFIGFFCLYLIRFDYLPDNGRNGDELAKYVKNLEVPNIVIAPDYYDLTFLYHFDQKMFKDVKVRENITKNGIYPIKEIQELSKFNFKGRVALLDIDFEFIRPGQSLQKWFSEKGYILLSVKKFKGNYIVYLFEERTIQPLTL